MSITPGSRFGLALGLATAASGALLLAAALTDGGSAPVYLLWNLFLAWLPFGLVIWLVYILRRKSWSSWEGLTASGLWLAFLPNSFYMVSDFIHLPEVPSSRLLFYVILYASFICTALALGISSLYLVHVRLRQRVGEQVAWAWILAILLVCCIAIYVGRDLRWNTWDVLVDPAGLLFDLSARLLRPATYAQVLGVVVPFFVLLTTAYAMVWYGLQSAAADFHIHITTKKRSVRAARRRSKH